MTRAAPRQALFFRLGDLVLALPGDGLRQVVPVGRLTPVPRVGPELLGLFSVRGEVLPLIDLRPLLGQRSADPAPGAERTAALLEHRSSRVALLLDEVLGFFPAQETTGGPLDPKLEPLAGSGAVHGTLAATVLEPGKLMAALERRLVLV